MAFYKEKNGEISKTILLIEKKIFAYANVLFRIGGNLWYNNLVLLTLNCPQKMRRINNVR